MLTTQHEGIVWFHNLSTSCTDGMVFQVAEEELKYGIMMNGYLGGPYAIKYSEVAMTVGAFQIVLGFFIFCRAFQASLMENTME